MLCALCFPVQSAGIQLQLPNSAGKFSSQSTRSSNSFGWDMVLLLLPFCSLWILITYSFTNSSYYCNVCNIERISTNCKGNQFSLKLNSCCRRRFSTHIQRCYFLTTRCHTFLNDDSSSIRQYCLLMDSTGWNCIRSFLLSLPMELAFPRFQKTCRAPLIRREQEGGHCDPALRVATVFQFGLTTRAC